ncbi:Ribosomal RNA-processing protein 8 [Entamoeba marina]
MFKKNKSKPNTSQIKSFKEKAPKKSLTSSNGKKKDQSLLDSFEKELEGSKFRYLNEMLYTCRGDQALHLFEEKPELFDQYHQGYEKQVESWPTNPLDIIISHIKASSNILNICDMGCGQARLSLECAEHNVKSFDLKKANDRVTVANISKVPVKKGWADVVVFCLSLMGVDWLMFLKEGFRVLKQNGIMYIAEPISRLKSIKTFANGLESFGFSVLEQEKNNVFVLFTIRKNPNQFVVGKTKMEVMKKKMHLAPCLYKKR